MKLESDSTPGIVPYKTTEHLLHEKTNHCPAFIPRKKNTGLIILGKCSPELVPALKKDMPILSELTETQVTTPMTK